MKILLITSVFVVTIQHFRLEKPTQSIPYRIHPHNVKAEIHNLI